MLTVPFPCGKYLIVEELSTGDGAMVYRALERGPDLEHEVAIKYPVLPPGVSVTIAAQTQARVQHLRDLSHLNIVQIQELGQSKEGYFLVMELVRGLDLARLTARATQSGAPLTPAIIAYIVAEAARGLARMHEDSPTGRTRGLLHRAIRPSSILVGADGNVKLGGFALLELRDPAIGAPLERLRYLSPEQVAGEPVDARADIYALGAVLYEALVGEPCVTAATHNEILREIAEACFAAPSARKPGLPGALDEIVLKALASDRSSRYTSAQEFRATLTCYLRETAPELTRASIAALVAPWAPLHGTLDQIDENQRRDYGEVSENIVPGEGERPLHTATPAPAPTPSTVRKLLPRVVLSSASGLAAALLLWWLWSPSLPPPTFETTPYMNSRPAEVTPPPVAPASSSGANVLIKNVRYQIVTINQTNQRLIIWLRLTNLGRGSATISLGKIKLTGALTSWPALASADTIQLPPERWREIRLEFAPAELSINPLLIFEGGQTLPVTLPSAASGDQGAG